jgi:hypothetical protein
MMPLRAALLMGAMVGLPCTTASLYTTLVEGSSTPSNILTLTQKYHVSRIFQNDKCKVSKDFQANPIITNNDIPNGTICIVKWIVEPVSESAIGLKLAPDNCSGELRYLFIGDNLDIYYGNFIRFNRVLSVFLFNLVKQWNVEKAHSFEGLSFEKNIFTL